MNEPTSGQLKGELSRQRSWVRWGAIAVIVGLIIEVWLAMESTSENAIEKWGTVFATALITLGVLLETIFGHKGDATSDTLQKLADQRTAEADARAAEANLELARLKERIAPRVLTDDQRAKLQEFAPRVTEVVVTSVSDAESAMLAWQIAQEIRCMRTLVLTPPAIHKVASGLFAVFPEAMNPFEREAHWTLLVGAGITAQMPRSWLPIDEHPDAIVIVAGQKPLEYAKSLPVAK